MSTFARIGTYCSVVCAFVATILGDASSSFASPTNLGDLKIQLAAYVDYGGYERDLADAAASAEKYIDAHAKDTNKLAIVLDIDETSLSNMEELRANDFGYITRGDTQKEDCTYLPVGPCSWNTWVGLQKATAIAPVLALFADAKVHGIAVFFVTGRHEGQRPATDSNLRAVGYRDYDGLYMEPDSLHPESAADFKTPARQDIESKGYHILANIGDQPSDLAGGHADRAFLLPDPFYRIP
jgi:predicted secreted acid phosphatase